MLLLPQRFAGLPGVDAGGRAAFQGLEIEVQPPVGGQALQLRPFAQLLDRLAGREGADQILLVPAREDDQFARGVVHAGPHHRGVPLPAVGADERRIGFERILIEVVQHEAVHAVARQRPFAPDGEQSAPAADDLDLVGRADVARGLRPLLDGRAGEKGGVLPRFEDALHAAVELRGQRPRVGGDGDPQVGVQPQQVGREQRRGPDALAVLRRHGDDQPPDAPRGESLQHAVIGPVEGLQFEKGIDAEGEIGEGGRRGGRLFGMRRLGKRRPGVHKNLCGGVPRRGRFGLFNHA